MNTDEYLKMVAQEEAKEEAEESFVRNLVTGTDFDTEKIASLAKVTVEFVDEIKERLQQTR
jgi:hypothetical protein